MTRTLLAHRYLFCHGYLSMLYLCMTPQTVYLLLPHMFFMNEFHVNVFFRSVDMTEITLVLWGHAVTLRYFRVALIAFVPCL